jgi:hypothetical protein
LPVPNVITPKASRETTSPELPSRVYSMALPRVFVAGGFSAPLT